MGEVWFAVPGIADDPVAGPLTVALYHALGDDADTHTDEIVQAASAAAEAATARDRRDVVTVLTGLTRTRDDRSTALGHIAAAFASPSVG